MVWVLRCTGQGVGVVDAERCTGHGVGVVEAEMYRAWCKYCGC